MASNNTVTKNLRIYGRVQGVSYRYWTQTTALGLGLSGWVRNRSDSSVEAMVHGDEDTVQKLITACNDGPPMAEVEKINIADASGDEWFDGFEIKPTL